MCVYVGVCVCVYGYGCVGVCVCVCVCGCVHVCVYICVLSLFSLSIIVSPILCTTDNTTMCLYYQYCRSTIAFHADYFLFRADVTENPPADWSRPVRHCGLAAEMPLEAFNAARRPVAGTASAVAALCINGYIENTLRHSGRQTHAGRRTTNRTLYNQALILHCKIREELIHQKRNFTKYAFNVDCLWRVLACGPFGQQPCEGWCRVSLGKGCLTCQRWWFTGQRSLCCLS